MLEVLIALAIASAVSALLAGLTFWVARRASDQMTKADEELRPRERQTGQCAACEGAGTRIETFPGRSGPNVQMVTCFRCGGDGLPLPAGETGRLPSSPPLRHTISQLREALELRSAARGQDKRSS